MTKLSETYQSYVCKMPDRTFNATVKSAIYSSTISFLIKRNVAAAAVSAVTASTATIIHTLTTPFFKKLFGSHQIGIIPNIVIRACNLSLTQTVFNNIYTYFTYWEIQLVGALVNPIALSILIGDRILDRWSANGGKPFNINHAFSYCTPLFA